MDIKILARGLAYVALAGALLAAAVALNNRQYPTAAVPKAESSPAPGALDAELARCKTIGTEAAADPACKAVWDSNRKRFFESKKLYQDRVTDDLPGTPDLQPPASSLEGDLTRSAPESPSTQTSTAPDGTRGN